MENNLYYTPTLKDLHYGFEFEYKSKDDNWVKVTLDTWNRPSKDNHLKYFTEYDLLRTLNHQDMACKYADLTCIRVKYLDQSDIESLGWIIKDFHFDGTPMLMGGTEIYFYITDKNNHEIEFRYSIKENYCIIMYTNKEGWIDYEQYLSLFQGSIKNKSELIKLMQQLNIK